MENSFTEISVKAGLEILRGDRLKVVRGAGQVSTIGEYLADITDAPLREGLLRVYDAHPFFKEVCAGAKHHHWWKGGLNDHCVEMIQIGMDLKALYNWDFSWLTYDDLVAAVFLHDFSKVFLYRYLNAGDFDRFPKPHARQVFTYQEAATNILDAENLTATVLMRAGVPVSDKIWSAVVFAEGGFSKAHFGFGGMPVKTGGTVNHANPLAAFLHVLDMYSAMLLGKALV